MANQFLYQKVKRNKPSDRLCKMSMLGFQLTQRKCLWFQNHASLPEAEWSHNGNHRQNCRLPGHEDDRLSTKQTQMI